VVLFCTFFSDDCIDRTSEKTSIALNTSLYQGS
jgi:hypothetical protein